MKLDDISRSILMLVSVYRVVTRAIIAAAVGGGADQDKRIRKLVDEGLLRTHKGLPGNRSVYQLTKRGAAVVGVSPARGRILGAQSLLKNLGVLLFCHQPDFERHRIDADSLGKALGATLSDAAYCLCRFREKTIILDCYVPSPQTPIPTIVRHLRKRLKQVRQIPQIAGAIKDLRFGFGLIVGSTARRKAIMDAVRTKSEDEKVPLIKRVRIWVEAIEELGVIFGNAMPSASERTRATEQIALFDT